MLWLWRFKRWRKERQEVKSLRRFIKKQERIYAPNIEAGGGIDAESIALDEFFDVINDAEVEIERRKTKSLIRKARNLGIDVPVDDPEWFLERITHNERIYKILSSTGETRLRLLIQKHRRENIEWWLKIIAALTGLIGTLIGLVAILK